MDNGEERVPGDRSPRGRSASSLSSTGLSGARSPSARGRRERGRSLPARPASVPRGVDPRQWTATTGAGHQPPVGAVPLFGPQFYQMGTPPQTAPQEPLQVPNMQCTWSSSTDGVHKSNAASTGRADPTAGSSTSTDECHADAGIAACKCECCKCTKCNSYNFIVDESYPWRKPLSIICECIDRCGYGSRLWCTKQEGRGLHPTIASAELCVHDE